MPSLFLNKHFKIIIHISFAGVCVFEALSYDRETIRIQGYGMMSLNLLSISQQHFGTPLHYPL